MATQLWPLVTALGSAATSVNGAQATLHGLMAQLGALCGGDAELWEQASEPAGESRWRLRAGHAMQPLALRPPAERQPDEQVARAAATLRTVAATEPNTSLAIPIFAFGRSQGVLWIAAPEADAAFAGWQGDLESLAAVLGLYLNAAELNEALASGVLRDRLTGIANQAQLHDHLEREVARARRGRRPFAMLMIAPDRFDALGVELGLPLRDRVTQSLAVMLRDACRNGDIIGRYGADRFLILLPDTGSQGAQTAAQRYLAHFYRRPIALPEGKALYLDVSIGISLFPVDGLTIAEMVEGATNALREAQRLGGNRAIAA